MTAAPPDNSSIAPGGSSHAVHFYENDDELSARVAAFIGEALLAGEPAGDHRVATSPPAVRRSPRAMNIDVEAERLAGNLTILDATATLGKFMVGGSPDRELFTRVVGSLIESVGTRGNRWVKVRAYGEMVDLLWQGANHAAAIALEEMWTDLGAVYPFDLLCAYAMAAFAEGPASAGVREICGEHSHVTVAAPGDGSADASGAIGGVDQRSQPSRDLAAEIARRKQVEMALRSSVQELKRAQAAERERAARAKQLADDLNETIRVNELFIGVLAHDLRAPLTAIMTPRALLRRRQAASPDAATRRCGAPHVQRRAHGADGRAAAGFHAAARGRRLRHRTAGRRSGVAGCDRWWTSWTAAIPTAPSTSARRATHAATGTPIDCARCSRTWWRTRSSTAFPPPASGSSSTGPTPDIVRVQVHNMGAIPAPLVTQMFDPLTGGQRRRDRSRGLGLGLFITQRIAEAHGGDVAVSSSETDGTTFTLSLPRVTRRCGVRGGARRTGAAAAHENVNLAALAQDQLRESQARFRLLVEAVKDYAIFMLDPSGRGHDVERRRRAHQGL